MKRWAVMFALLALAACGPDIGKLDKGERAHVVRVASGDTLELDNGMRVFLAEVDAPHGQEAYADTSRAELESLALHRQIQLAYGGTRRWTPRSRDNGDATTTAQGPAETAIADVFVESEGGRWFWLERELVSRGAVMVRPRHDNHARAAELMSAESDARGAKKGLWALRDYRVLKTEEAATAALSANVNCLRRDSPYRIVEAHIANAEVLDRRASLDVEAGDASQAFAIVLFGDSFAQWRGPPLASLAGKRVRVHGSLGVFRDHPQLCLDDASQLEVLG
ncbi:MAG: thermonuclease family protein [Pseudomonadota bacterium]